MRILTAILLLVIAWGPATAQVRKPVQHPKAVAKPAVQKRAPDQAKAPRDTTQSERMAIQFDLAWTAEYVGLMDGEFNEKTGAAIKAFQRARKFRETGTLNAQERAALAAAAKARQSHAGWSMVEDPAT